MDTGDIFLWKISDDYPDHLIGTYQREVSPDRFVFQKGQEVLFASPEPLITFEAPPEALRRFSDLANSALVPLVSPDIAAILERYCPGDVQLIHARVLASGSDLPGYRIVNATHTVRSIDHKQSVYSLIPGTDAIMSFKRLVCLPGCLGAHDIARDEEYLSNLLVSKSLRDLLTGAEGIGLYHPEEMSW